MTMISKNTKPRLWVYTGARASNSAKELAAQPGFLRLRDERFHKVRPNDFVINWGVSSPVAGVKFHFNQPPAIKKATDKLQAFIAMEDAKVRTVKFTDDIQEALKWCQNGATVVARMKLTGHSGDGIVIIEKGKVNTLPQMMEFEAPLYTHYIFKEKEFRVHVVRNKVVDTQRKIKDPDVEEVKSWKVRSHDNGFIFARNDISPSADRDAVAINACKALGLDFGAVDIVQDKSGTYFVLEVNTAPGLEGASVTNYSKMLMEMALGG